MSLGGQFGLSPNIEGCGAARTDAEHQGWAEPITLFQTIQLAGNWSKAIAILSDRQT